MSIRMRHTRSHTRNRRGHHKLTAPRMSVDKETGSTHLRHRVDMATGMYRGKKIIDIGARAQKDAAKMVKKMVKSGQLKMKDGSETKLPKVDKKDTKVKKVKAIAKPRAARRVATASSSKAG